MEIDSANTKSSMLDMTLDDIVKRSRHVSISRRRGNQKELPSSSSAGRVGINRPSSSFKGIPSFGDSSSSFRRRRRIDGNWNHDLYEHENRGGRGSLDFSRRVMFGSRGEDRRTLPTMVEISNLEYSIMEEDLRELFASNGADIVKVWINYDRTDRSEGTGGCLFKTYQDAKAAVEAYNGRTIEGMAVKLAITDGRGRGGMRGGRGGGRGGW